MLNPGQRIAHLEVLEQLGAGGMGVVYKARDLQLDRIVALKVLAAGRADDEAMQSRLLREARAASALNHPNIVTIHEAGSEQGVHYIVMEFLEGVTLADRIPPAGMPVADAIAVAQAIAAALAAAHAAGIVHRDLKPANVMVRPDGTVKVMDFGLAKALLPPTGEADATRTVGDTAAGVVLGTGPYMSPEQAEGKAVDARSDIFSFGAMFYEMLTGRRAFLGDTLISTISSVLKETPPSIHSLRGEVEPALEQVVNRCLQKDREGRYPSGAELAAALSPMTAQPAPAGSRRAKVATAAVVMAALAVAAAWWGIGQRRAQRVRNTTVPEIYRLRADMQYLAAFQLAMQARQILPADPAVEQAVISCCPIFPIHSQPPGARIYYRPYLEPNAPEQLLGQTPANFPLPLAIIRVRVVKEGYEDAEGTIEPRPGLEFVLEPKGTRPPGMVTVPAGIQSWNGNPVQLAPYWLDKYEVSNRKFKEFVDQGGYRKREYWKHPFVKDGREIPWEDALRLMVDSTGRPGPATWELGSYAEGRGDYPVGGVSWYEAAAYAEFAGKSLPTVAHWRRAAAFGQFSEILRLSNFGQGPAPVGKFPGIGPFGTFDMAGNVSEWCFNATSNARRAALGGSWQEASYRFRDFDARDPMERLPIYGFRCAKYREAPPESAFQPAQKPARDPSKETPASDEVFNSWRTSYAYDKTPLDAKVESVDDSAEYYRKEKISFLTAYGGERIQALLLLPKNARPPYQTVVYYPSGDAVFSRDSSVIGTQRHLQYFPRSGRALLHPIYQGTYERIKAPPDGPNAVRELVVQRSQDMRRAIDYLETRSDIDSGKLAFHGISMGCREGTVAVALEPRFRTAILAYCGIPDVRYPGIDPLDFVPRIKIPVLLLEGREDFTFPYETSQLPMFHLLGSPASDKKLVVRDGGHIVALSPEIVRQNLDWLDHYLGPVK